MGTRGLTIVFHDGKYKVAQYGQWDHYPRGQGTTVLEFCQEWLTKPERRTVFISQLNKCRYVTDEEAESYVTKTYEDLGTSRENNPLKGFWPMDHSEHLHAKYLPLTNRDVGAEILGAIATGVWTKSKYDYKLRDYKVTEVPVGNYLLADGIDFVGDSLFCEWAYVVDLDKNELQVYRGFQDKPIAETERFYSFYKEREHRQLNQYYPVKFLRAYRLDDLPSVETFIEQLTPVEE